MTVIINGKREKSTKWQTQNIGLGANIETSVSSLTFILTIFALKSNRTDTLAVVRLIPVTIGARSVVFAYNTIADTLDYNTIELSDYQKIEFSISRSNLSHERPLNPLGQWQNCIVESYTPSFIQKWATPGSCVLVDVVEAVVVTAVPLPRSQTVRLWKNYFREQIIFLS